jgi:apolipoprotein N-acyltransferase
LFVLVILCLLSAFLYALAIPDVLYSQGCILAGFVCLAPYLLALRRTRSARDAAFCGFIFGGAAHFLTSFWLANFGSATMGSGILGAAIVIATTLYYALAQMVVAQFLRAADRIRSAAAPVITALVWTAWEWLRSTGFMGYPWGLLAYSAVGVPLLMQTADMWGVYGIGFLLALGSALAASFGGREGEYRADGSRFRLAAIYFVLLILFFAYGAFRLARPVPTASRIPMLLVQENTSPQESGEEGILGTAISLTRRGLGEYAEQHNGEKPTLIVWPESVLLHGEIKPFYQDFPRGDALLPFLENCGVPLLTGGVMIAGETPSGANYSNAALLLEGGNLLASYAKQHLVPFAERMPFQEYEWMRKLMRAAVGFDWTWTPGRESTVMALKSVSNTLLFGTPICFEDAFSSVCTGFVRRGADLLINLTDDSWSRNISAEEQHLAAARYRAVENRRVLVRATCSGITAVIDAEGRVLKTLPPFRPAWLNIEVPIQINGN